MKRALGFLIAAAVFAPVGWAAARDVSFLVVSDTHYGRYGRDNRPDNEPGNKSVIAEMNGLPGKAYPKAGWGNVATPRGVLVCGDLTDGGKSLQWSGSPSVAGFEDDFPVRGGTGVHLHYPVYECYGNHDVVKGSDGSVLSGIAGRNNNRATPVNKSSNGYHYSWNWDDVHFVCLNVYPGTGADARNSLGFLESDLAAKVGGNGRPVILCQHFGFDSLSTNGDWWSQAERDAFYHVIQNYNVAAIFSGHEHKCERVDWHGIPTFVAPYAQGGKGANDRTDGFYAVGVRDGKMIVAQRRLSGTWGSTWVVDIKGRAGAGRLDTSGLWPATAHDSSAPANSQRMDYKCLTTIRDQK